MERSGTPMGGIQMLTSSSSINRKSISYSPSENTSLIHPIELESASPTPTLANASARQKKQRRTSRVFYLFGSRLSRNSKVANSILVGRVMG
jgi:hypothetical protein